MSEYLKIGAMRNNPAVESINHVGGADLKAHVVAQMEKALAVSEGKECFMGTEFKAIPIKFRK